LKWKTNIAGQGFRPAVGLLPGVLLLTASACAQTFETASIKPNDAIGQAGVIKPTTGALTAQNVSVKTCIEWAWNLREDQIVVPPSLTHAATEAHYDITARAPGNASVDQLKLMLQDLLTERFHLALHTEKKDGKVLALVVAKGGPKNLKAPAPDEKADMEPSSIDVDGQHWIFHNSDMKGLAGFLSSPGLDSPVLDMTGLTNHYTFTFVNPIWNRDEGSLADHMLREVFPEVQRQLGLKIEGRTAPSDVTVIDRVDKTPTDN